MRKHTGDPAEGRAVNAEEAREKYQEALAEAERFWRASVLAIARGVDAQDRLAAAQMARDAAFCVWCDLTAIERTAHSNNTGTTAE